MEIRNFKKLRFPDKPGVYFFKNKNEIIYIGKATSLKDRVKSYMSKTVFDTRGPLIEKMVQEAEKIEWKETDSVLEALILEANLIKKYQPYFNTKEKDDKSFNYVVLTKEKLPKVLVVRGRNLQKKQENFPVSFAEIFGPYTSGTQLYEALKIVRRIFPFLDEKSKNYLEFYKQINLIPDLQDRKLYLQNIRNIKLFFIGKKKQILRNLKKEMQGYAKGREFEKAGEIKRQIFALQHINDVALLKSETQKQENFSHVTLPGVPGGTLADKNFPVSRFRLEAYDIAHMGSKNMVGAMTVIIDGEVEKSEYKKFKIRTQINTNDTGALKEVLERRLAHPEWIYPDLIVVDGGVAQLNVAKKVLHALHINISVVAVVKNEKHKPKAILGNEEIIKKYKREILLANSEAHRFAINYHKNIRNKNFLK